ncbi:hypothetical protein B0O80DRAFT_67031 [Mortierella sp. GBAus27b]|nr:hypothetical protein B0O80DRAFT_67031 [Mortierella sp. GBAus27b]
MLDVCHVSCFLSSVPFVCALGMVLLCGELDPGARFQVLGHTGLDLLGRHGARGTSCFAPCRSSDGSCNSGFDVSISLIVPVVDSFQGSYRVVLVFLVLIFILVAVGIALVLSA